MIDVHVVDHCNLRCTGCIHFAPLAKPSFLNLEEYERDLAALASIPHIDKYLHRLCLMGGEPLLHPKLPEVIRLSRSYLPNTDIALDSNGLLLGRMGTDFWQAMAACKIELTLSPYPLRINYPALLDLATQHGVSAHLAGDVTGSGQDKEVFFHLAIDPSASQNPVASHNRCPFGGRFMQLYDGRLWPCQVTAHHDPLNQHFGTQLQAQEQDSLPLEIISSIDQIEDFRRRPHPMCRYCDNDHLTVVKWSIPHRQACEWLAPQT